MKSKSTSIIMKNLIKTIPFIVAFAFMIPSANAAKYLLSDNDSLVRGCNGTIEIKIDTEGDSVMAGDSTISVRSSELVVNQLTIGSILPMQMFHQISGDTLKLSGARLPTSGTFNGTGTFGYINFLPDENASSGSFNFSNDLLIENNLVDDNITNVLTSAVSKTYNFAERYNKEVDGVGFCNPDNIAPSVQFITPIPNSSNNPLDTNIIFVLSDNRAGVNISSLEFTIDGVTYTNTSSQVTVNEDQEFYRVEVDPDVDFSEGAAVRVSVDACDSNSSANCSTSPVSFRMFTPAPPPPVCGNGAVEPNNGEQCDDGNADSGDGCSTFCLLEVISGPATCSDGVQNQGESGLDCGGPCSNACATCVDGSLNQGEESVDCGGPCPSCGQQSTLSCPVYEEPGTVTICHYSEEDPENPINLVIPENSWRAHEIHGDSLGACPAFDLCSEALLLAAPEREEKALENIEAIIEEQGVVEEQATVIEAPKAQSEVVNQLDVCKQNPSYADANFDDASADTDGDGLSDRMECYAETNPVDSDGDDDGCSDFDELNLYFSNPNDAGDCKIEAEVETFSEVIITDPQPGWILSKERPGISGKVPANTVLVLVVATQSEQPLISGTLRNIEVLLNSSSGESVTLISKFNEQILKVQTFLEDNGGDFNSEAITAIYASMPEISGSITSDIKSELTEIKAQLLVIKANPIVAAASTTLSETNVGEFEAKNFEETSNALRDRQLYDLVATAYLNDGSQTSSRAVRFSVDKATTIHTPVPRTIGGKLIESNSTAFNGGFFIGDVYAQDEDGDGVIEIEIEEPRPSVTGETEFGSQVFAIWNSVVLASSVISDSEQGAFEVQAPRNLEVGTPHHVTLYAVKTQDGNKIRSENVNVYFTIKAPGVGAWPFVATAGGLAVLMISIFIVRRLLAVRATMKLLIK